MSVPEPDPQVVAELVASLAQGLIDDQQAEVDRANQAITDLNDRYQSELAAWQQRAAVAQAAIDEINQFTQWRTDTIAPQPMPVTTGPASA